jgi:hypothetical protein
MAATSLRSRASAPRTQRVPYVLDEDLSRRMGRARAELGADVRTFVQDGALLFVAPDGGAAVDGYAERAHRALAAYRAPGRLRSGPERAVTVYVQSTDETYARFCRQHLHRPCDAPWGFTLLGSREIFVNAAHGAGTLLHEMLHPLMADDWSDRDRLPRWLGEGMAALFEQSRFTTDGDLRGEKNGRLETLLRGLADGDPAARMSALFGMSDDAFRGEEEGDAGGQLLLERHEATARYLMLWLQDTRADEGGPWRFYREWRDGLGGDAGDAGDETGARAFARVVGRTPDDAEGDWERWVKTL